MRRYLKNAIENMRDIGGYKVGEKKVKYGKLIRSNLPIAITKEDINILKEMGIKIVIDLRSKEEINEKVSVFEDDVFFDILNYEIYGGRKVPDSPKKVPISYMQMLEGKNSIYQIFKELAKAEHGIIYFCNAGKDRTGVVTALILMTLGVKKEDIVSDYILSKDYLGNRLNELSKKFKNENMKEIITPKTEYMEQFLQYFEQKYVNINQYLHEIGITDNDINQIREKYIQ